MKNKQPYTVRVIDPKKANALRLIKQETGIPIERVVDELLDIGMKAKKFKLNPAQITL